MEVTGAASVMPWAANASVTALALTPSLEVTSAWTIRCPTPLNVSGAAGTVLTAARRSLPAVREAFRRLACPDEPLV